MDSVPSPYSCLDDASHAFVARVLAAARDYLGARVSFLAEVAGPDKLIRATDGDAEASGVAAGTRFDLEDAYCYRLLSGRIPEAIYDARTNPLSCGIPLTARLGIDSYMGVPVLLGDGRAFGTLCCINFEPSPEHCARDVAFLRFLAGLLAGELDAAMHRADLSRHRLDAIHAVLAAGGPTMLFHPIVSLRDGRIAGVEALARFEGPGPAAPPDAWFRDAWAAGAGVEAEVAAVRGALWALPCLDEEMFLSLNVSPATLLSPDFLRALASVPKQRIVLEVTEHAPVDDYDALARALSALRDTGLRLAIDDVGAGYSSLRHVLRLAPQILKLDLSLTHDIDTDLARQAMAAGVMAFATRTGALVIAEGVETRAEADALAASGVQYAQGFLYGRPAPLARVLDRTALA